MLIDLLTLGRITFHLLVVSGESCITACLLLDGAAPESLLHVSIVNHSGLLSALRRGDTHC